MPNNQEKTSRKRPGLTLKKFRTLHRTMAAFLFVFIFIVAVTGLALAWKKHSGNIIMPATQKSIPIELSQWKDIAILEELAVDTLANLLNSKQAGSPISVFVDRIDIRKNKGVAKFLFTEGFWEVQLSGSTGEVLSVGRRHSEWIENLHDGSILDDLIGAPNDLFKLLFSNIAGIGLLLFTVTGFWMWYGPKRMRKK